jgi:hypothetical protein
MEQRKLSKTALPLLFPQLALLHSVTYILLKLDKNSRKLRLRCGFQFPSSALALIVSGRKQKRSALFQH